MRMTGRVLSIVGLGVIGLTTSAGGEEITRTGACRVPASARDTLMSLTERMHFRRFTVVEVSAAEGRVRIKPAAGLLMDLDCQKNTLVISDSGQQNGLGAIQPGDIVGLSRPGAVVVHRRAAEELTSPE